ncbi:hypothetical protein A2U01_0033332, partial [Trifolium medium]|nr:hypothetical protein [Trifolium medium]
MLCGGNQQRQIEGQHRSDNPVGWFRWELTNVAQ